MLDETHHFILIIIYAACPECEIFRNLQATKKARPKSRFNAHISGNCPSSFFDEVYSKFEIYEKTVSKDYSLERPRQTRNITTR